SRDESGDFTFQAKAYRFQVIERPEGELSIDELIDVVNTRELTFPPAGAHGRGILDRAVPYVAALGGSQVGNGLDSPTEHPLAGSYGRSILDPAVPYVVALGDSQIGKGIDSPTEELLDRILTLLERAATPIAAHLEETGEKFAHIHVPFLGDCIETFNSQGG